MKEIKASTTGLVVEFLVQPGETVRACQDVVVLESMKMYISEQVKRGGLVKRLRAKAGEIIHAGEVLLEVEEHPQATRGD